MVNSLLFVCCCCLLFITLAPCVWGADHDACTAPCECYYRSGEFYVDCHDSGLSKIPINIPTKTIRLYLQGNDISDVGIESHLALLPNLEVLFLHNNPITNLTVNAFENVTKMQMLLLHYTEIWELPNGIFDNNPELEYLWFSHSNIHVLGTTVFNTLTKLKELLLDSNSIPGLHVGMFKNLQSLKTLNFKNNGIAAPSCCQMCGVPTSTHIDYNLRPLTDTHLECACQDTAVCTEPDGGTFAVNDCYPQNSNVCPDYFFNSAPSLRGSVFIVVVSIVVCVLACM